MLFLYLVRFSIISVVGHISQGTKVGIWFLESLCDHHGVSLCFLVNVDFGWSFGIFTNYFVKLVISVEQLFFDKLDPSSFFELEDSLVVFKVANVAELG